MGRGDRSPMYPGNFGHGYFEHGGGAHPLAWAIFAVLLALLVVVTLAVAARFAGGRHRHWRPMGPPGGFPPDPLDLVRFRYARGEITRDEFLQLSGDLGAGPDQVAEPPPP